MQQQLMEYLKDVCQKQFGDELVDIKVNFSVPHQAFVQVVVKTVTSQSEAFAGELEQEFAELDRHINIQVVAG